MSNLHSLKTLVFVFLLLFPRGLAHHWRNCTSSSQAEGLPHNLQSTSNTSHLEISTSCASRLLTPIVSPAHSSRCSHRSLQSSSQASLGSADHGSTAGLSATETSAIEAFVIQTPSPKPNPIGRNGKRGLAYNTPSLTLLFLDSPSVTWAFNWDQVSGTVFPKEAFEFVPMLWGTNTVHTNRWESAVQEAQNTRVQNVMGFNEPDVAEQANLSVAAAVEGWNQFLEPLADRYNLISPAVSNDGSQGKGLNWLRDFLAQCQGCSIGGCAIHWYGTPFEARGFMDHMATARQVCGSRPIWVTEFGLHQSQTASEDNLEAFLNTVLPWMDQQSYIERYAYFPVVDYVVMPDPRGLVSADGEARSSLGMLYSG